MSEKEQKLEQLGFGESYRDELCSMLEASQLLSDMDRNDIVTLSDYCGAYLAHKGTRVFSEGDKGSFFCILVHGRIDIMKAGAGAVRSGLKRIATVRPGKCMGEMSIIDGYPHSATAEAIEDSRLVMITRHNFEKIAEEHPKLALDLYQRIAKLLSLRLRQTTGILYDYLD